MVTFIHCLIVLRNLAYVPFLSDSSNLQVQVDTHIDGDTIQHKGFAFNSEVSQYGQDGRHDKTDQLLSLEKNYSTIEQCHSNAIASRSHSNEM